MMISDLLRLEQHFPENAVQDKDIERAEALEAVAEAAEQIYNAVDIRGNDFCPHGISTKSPASAWYCDDCMFALRDALDRLQEVQDE